jgi:hypothetical protein
LIFVFTSVNLIINILLFTIICISARNSSILKPYQRAYLAFSIIIWLIITLYYLAKIALLIYFSIEKRYILRGVKWYIEKVYFFWRIFFGFAFLFMFIGFIYDIAKIMEGKIETVKYPIIYFVVCFVYVILTFFDYIFIEKSVYSILREMLKLDNSDNSDEDNSEHKRKNSEGIKLKKSDRSSESLKPKHD